MASEPRWTREDVEFPRGADLARQLGIVAAIVLVWGTSFSLAMRIPTESAADVAAEVRREARRAAAATEDPATSAPAEPSGSEQDPAAPDGSAPESDPSPPSTSGAADTAALRGSAAPTPSNESGSSTASAPVPASSTPATAAPTGPADPIAAIAREESASLLPDVSDHPPVSFAADVLPILQDRCITCHGGIRDDGSLRIEEGLDLRTVETILAGSTWGSVVEPGDPAGSYMLELIVDGDMPDEGPRLLPGEIRAIAAWIHQGAGGG